MKHFLNLFLRENSVRGASLILMLTLTLSNILGLFRDRFLAKNIDFADLDIYFAAFRIPDTIFNLLILGAISSAFIPIFSDYLSNKKYEEGFALVNSLINIAAISMMVMAIILYLLMPWATRLVVPNFSPDRFDQTVELSRLLMLTPIFFSISYIVSGVLNSYKRFFACAVAPLVYNLSIIVGALWAAPRYGITGVVYFVIFGALLHVLIQLPALYKVKYRYRTLLNLQDKTLQRIVRLMLPRSLSLGANQIMLTIFTSIGSALQSGAIAAFTFSNNIQTVPVVILGNSFATAVFPTLAEKAATNDRDGFSAYLIQTIRIITFLILPATVIFILMRAQIVRLIIGSGKVGWGDTKMTALALGFFAISFIAQSLTPLLARAFFALKNTKTPMYIALVSVALSIFLAYPLTKELSVAGLAFAFSLGSFVQVALLLIYLRQSFPQIFQRSLLVAEIRLAFLALAMAGFTWPIMHFIGDLVDMTRFTGVLIQFTATSLAGLAIYLILNRLFAAEEMGWITSSPFSAKPKTVEALAEENLSEGAANTL